MTLLKEGDKREFKTPPETRELHRKAAVLASLIGSAELTEAIDFQYQKSLELWHLRADLSPDRTLEVMAEYQERSDELMMESEAEALEVINIIRSETGVPGQLAHQWF